MLVTEAKLKGNINLDDTSLAIFPEYSKGDVLDTHNSMVKKKKKKKKKKKCQTPKFEV